MEPNTKAREIHIKERTFPFIFQGLGFFLVKDGAPESELEEEPRNPRDISHLLKRDYKYEAFRSQIIMLVIRLPARLPLSRAIKY